VHFTGALLLDPADAALLDEHLRFAPAAAAAAAGGAAAPAPAGEEGEGVGIGGGGFGGWSDDDAGGYYPGDAGGEAEPAAGAPRSEGAFEGEEEEEEDPWAPLDFNDAQGLPVRPFRKARPPRREPAPAAGLGAAAAIALLEARAAKRVGAVFPEFTYAHEARAKAVAKAARTAAAAARGAKQPAAAAAHGLFSLDAGDVDDFLDGGGFGDANGWDDDGYAGPPEEGMEPLDAAALEAAAAAGTAAEVGAAAARRAAGGAGGPASEEPSYAELVRAHVESCLASAAASEVQSELAGRVAGWRARIEPALAEQEARPGFDIHKAGAEVVSALTEAGGGLVPEDWTPTPETPEPPPAQPASFSAMFAGQPAYAVARAFAATLQLVNSGNVALQEGGGGGEGGCPTSFSLQLLSLDSAHAALDEFRAPSLTDAGEEAGAAAAGGKGGKAAPAGQGRAKAAGGKGKTSKRAALADKQAMEQ